MHEVTGSHQPCFTKWKTDAGFSLHEVSFLVDLVFHCALNTKESFGVNIDKESWTLKNLFFQTVVLEKTLENPLNSEEIKPVNPKGNQSCIFTGRAGAEGEAPILWPPDAKSRLVRKDPDAGKDWRQEKKGMTEDEMAEWRYWLDGHEFEQGLGMVMDREAWCGAVHWVTNRQDWETEQQQY